MTAELKFIELDGKTHVVGFSEHTACGLVIPIGETYTFDEPKSLCAQCRKLTEDSDEYGVLKADIEADAPTTWNEGNLSSAETTDEAAEPVDAPTPAAKPKATKEAPSGSKAKA